MKTLRRGLAPLLLIILALLLRPFDAVAQNATNNPDQARLVAAQLNAWRLEQNLPPVVRNPLLDRMALDQALYIASRWTADFPTSEIHTGPQGETARQRALFPNNNWAVYGAPAQLSFAEIATLSPNARGAISWWRGSDFHTRTIVNPVYREIGVAAVPYPRGFIYIAIFANQPNVLPAFADPRNKMLYLTNENYTSGQGSWLRSATEVRLFDDLGRPLTAWMPWQPRMEIPTGARQQITILYRNGDNMVTTTISLRESDVLLPTYADAWQPLGQTTVVTAPTVAPPTPAPQLSQPTSVAAVPTTRPANAPTVSAPTAAAPSRTAPTAVPPTAVPPTTAPVTTTNQITLVWDQTMLAIIPGRAGIDITTLTLSVPGGNRPLRFGNVVIQGLRGSLNALNARDCPILAIDGVQTFTPTACTFRAVTFLTPERALWRQDFTIERNGTLIASCRSADRTCTVPLG